MWIALLSSLICLVVAIVLFTPMFRTAPLFRPVAVFFTFEGVWVVCNYLVTQIWPTNTTMQWIHYTGIIVFGGYLLLCLFYSRPKKPKVEKEKKRRVKKNRTSKRVS
ncbi:MAG TPA: hypothetical protein GX401_08245 [Clostridiales bacterium]|nr:hypothetical protein [Clostridiales bacterium]